MEVPTAVSVAPAPWVVDADTAFAMPKSATTAVPLEQHVLRLDVAVDDAVLVGINERLRHVPEDAQGLAHGERSARELHSQRFAVGERHHIKQKSIGRAAVEQRQNVRMLQRRGGLDFLHEALGAEHRREFGLEQLERDFAIVLQVLGAIDACHAALAEVAEDAIAASEGGVEAVGLLGHAGLGRGESKRLRAYLDASDPGLMQDVRIDIGAVGPYDCSEFRIDAHTLEQRPVAHHGLKNGAAQERPQIDVPLLTVIKSKTNPVIGEHGNTDDVDHGLFLTRAVRSPGAAIRVARDANCSQVPLCAA